MNVRSIKEATSSVHAELEGLLIPFIKQIESREEYIQLLQIFYGFYSPLEQQIFANLTEQHLPDKNLRRKSSWIRDDLRNMNQDPGIDVCSHVPQVSDFAQAFGALYVLEGSTLGGKMISRMIAERLSDEGASFMFFAGYGTDTGKFWKAFQEYMADTLVDDTAWDQACDTAYNTFVQFKNWAVSNIYVSD